MQVKIFESHDVNSALKKVKETFGPDALILSTRTVRKNGLGILSRPMVEITAAIDPPTSSSWLTPEPAKKPTRTAGRDLPMGAGINFYEKIRQQDRAVGQDKTDTVDQSGIYPYDPRDPHFIHGEIKKLKGLVEDLMQKKSTGFDADLLDAGQKQLAEEKLLAPFHSTLDSYGINNAAAEKIIQTARESGFLNQQNSPEAIASFLRKTIAAMIRISEPLRPTAGPQRRVALIGPTGVGKTTTIAKLAAHHLQKYGSNIALITIDTFRIAAVEQLKIYGEIMKLPVEVVMKPSQLSEVFDRHREKDMLLIDTAGRSPRDEASIEELTSFFDDTYRIENHLVLSANTTGENLDEAVRRFGCLPLHSLIFTKLDECLRLGSLCNVPTTHDCPVSYLTNGQRVPEDILFPTEEMITELIISAQT